MAIDLKINDGLITVIKAGTPTSPTTTELQVTPQQPSGRKKKCGKCFRVFPIEEFGNNKTSSDGYQTYCRGCRNKVHTKMRQTDLSLRLHHHFHTRITTQLLDKDLKVPVDLYASMEYYLGYTFKSLVRKLDSECISTFGFNLKKALNEHKYHIDHIRPMSSFDITGINDPLFKKCWGIANLKAIPASENLSKGAKFEIPDDVETP